MYVAIRRRRTASPTSRGIRLTDCYTGRTLSPSCPSAGLHARYRCSRYLGGEGSVSGASAGNAAIYAAAIPGRGRLSRLGAALSARLPVRNRDSIIVARSVSSCARGSIEA